MAKLFSPIKVGRCELRHRVVLAPLTRFRSDLKAVPNELLVDYYTQRASPGGLLVTEATFIHRLAGNYRFAPGIYTEDHIEKWKEVTSSVHKKGAIIFLQLWHVGRAGYSSLNPNNEQVVSASDIRILAKRPIDDEDYETPRALTIKEIKELVEIYRQAAINAMKAGFDGVEIHSANGYLLDQFINSNSNKRTDNYGGSIGNRSRFVLEVVDAITDSIGEDRTAIRFSPGGTWQDMKDDTTVETWSHLTAQLQKNHPKMAYLHFIESRSDFFVDGLVNVVDSLAPYRLLWHGPFVSAGGFSNTIDWAKELAEKTGTLIAFGRAFLANPDLPEKIKKGYELTKYDRKTFYTQGEVGYTDYPFHHHL